VCRSVRCSWAGGRNESGYLYGELDHFPNGMKKVVDYVHSKGLAFGLYTCGGTQTCVGNRPGSKDHWKQDADVFAEWGVDWVKMDWCNSKGEIPNQTYPLMSKALNESGRHIHFNM
jgi:alpha-galactosidase